MHNAYDCVRAGGFGMTGGGYAGGTDCEGVAAMDSRAIVMTIKTADCRAILNNGLDACVPCRLQGARVGYVITGGAMAQGANASMKSKNAIGAGPGGGGELRCI